MTARDEIEQLLAAHSAEVRALARTLEEIVLTAQPDLEEDASLRLKVIYFRHRGGVCALSLHKAHVNLHFYQGTRLADPQGLLQGTSIKLRHLHVARPEDIGRETIVRLVREAYALNA